MASGPILNPGQLNRLAASVIVASNTLLNVTPDFLGQGTLRLSPQGNITDFIDVLTAMIPSPVPFIGLTIAMPILKTLPVAAAWQAQMQSNSLIGAITVRPDVMRGSGGLQPFSLQNCGIIECREMDFGGKDTDFGVIVRGTWYLNSALWSGVNSSS